MLHSEIRKLETSADTPRLGHDLDSIERICYKRRICQSEHMEGGPSLSLGLSSIGGTYSTMVEAIIRPPRYDVRDAYPPKYPKITTFAAFLQNALHHCRSGTTQIPSGQEDLPEN